MDKPIGTYSFLSYLRVGLANRITQPDGDPVKLRATFDVQLSLEGQSVSGAPALQEPIQQPVELYGPATSSASTGAPSSRPIRTTGSPTSSLTIFRTSTSTTRTSPGATHRAAPTSRNTG
jgi:hypothetical protein